VATSTGLLNCDYVIVDPPRKGLDDEVISALTADLTCQAEAPQRLIYISCGFKAFRRDCDALVGSKLWTLIHAEGHVLFPGSDHIETLAIFDRYSEYV
jgi:tRNA/tmRNA/rRNA uracil-C5-methylase (TrmA/RlmC/RlmD family)